MIRATKAEYFERLRRDDEEEEMEMAREREREKWDDEELERELEKWDYEEGKKKEEGKGEDQSEEDAVRKVRSRFFLPLFPQVRRRRQTD